MRKCLLPTRRWVVGVNPMILPGQPCFWLPMMQPGSRANRSPFQAACMVFKHVKAKYQSNKTVYCLSWQRAFPSEERDHEYELYLALEDIDHSRTRPGIPKPMESVNASTKPSRMSFTPLPSGRRCTSHWSRFRLI